MAICIKTPNLRLRGCRGHAMSDRKSATHDAEGTKFLPSVSLVAIFEFRSHARGIF